jgi:hypothetical protein
LASGFAVERREAADALDKAKAQAFARPGFASTAAIGAAVIETIVTRPC